ncbi:MAG: 4Fe-4S dicluster domain-containing protein [Candidatus Korobacteraceae bacterium]|jgi:heterodisulfide reductase subunit C
MEPSAAVDKIARIEALAHTQLAKCYQCGKCTAGCPAAGNMELTPNQIMRLLQLGFDDVVLASASIWSCVSCLTCSARCPKEVDCAAVMDALRELSLREGKTSPEAQTVVAFQQAFLDNVRRNGRLNELELIARFKLTAAMRTRRLSLLFKDAGLAPQLRRRKKLHLSSERARDLEVVGRIYARCQEAGQK